MEISDHSLIYICRKISIPKEQTKLIETREFKNFNTIGFQNNLREAFSNFEHYTNPNKAWHKWKETFLQIADHHAPLRLSKVKSEYKPWLTNEIKNISHRRDFLKKKAVSLNSSAYHEAYKQCTNLETSTNSKLKARKS